LLDSLLQEINIAMGISESPNAIPRSFPVLEEALRRRRAYYESKSAGYKTGVLVVVCTLALLDANYAVVLRCCLGAHKSVYALSLLIYLVEMAVFAVSLTSLLTLCWRWVSPLLMYTGAPLTLSDEQFRLLRLSPDTPGFARSPDRAGAGGSMAERYPSPFSPLPGSLISRTSSPQGTTSPGATTTPANNKSYNNSSWLSNSHSPTTSNNMSLNNTSNLRRDHYSGYDDSPITDEVQLAEYLHDYSAWEQSHLSDQQQRLDDTASVTSQSGGAMLFWRSGAQPDPTLMRKTVYQLSSPASNSGSGSGGSGGGISGSGSGSGSVTGDLGHLSGDSLVDQAQARVLSQRLGVDPMRLVMWNENLRVWMTQTILRPLVSEIETVNAALPKHGVSDCKIGESPIDRLRKVSSLPQVASSLPTLSALLPFLEVSQDQEYVVSRLKELSSTGALSMYRWCSGGKCRGQAWTDKLPTDSELLLHLLASYLDSRLVASSTTRLADSRDSMPFTHSHFFKFGEKIEQVDKDFLAIVQIKARPPHYVVQVGDKQLDVGGGRNNLLHSLLLFLQQVREERAGMIGRVNLGLSGLNILWVLD